jgi:hypothetical protein
MYPFFGVVGECAGRHIIDAVPKMLLLGATTGFSYFLVRAALHAFGNNTP